MYQHPSMSQQVMLFEQEQLKRAAEERRFLREHADQIVPRPAGPLRRLLGRLTGRATAARSSASRPAACAGEPATVR